MGFLTHTTLLFLCCLVVIGAYTLDQKGAPTFSKRLSNDALIRLMIRHQQNVLATKRHEKRAEFERRSVDDDFSNCFLSPVQCMLPRTRR
ncbi:hypothetical protein Q1695_001107 [Nippostrongylus brasiliensis]|nr:hypothetical protein Q1695_001107 [Nippostrongylus brasiliensis]